MSREHISLAVLGMDQHENGVLAVSRILGEAQMQVSYLGRFQTPDSIVERMRAQPAQVIGISCHSWEYLELVPQLIEKLRANNLDMPVVIGGSVITTRDAETMKAAGVAAVFSSGASDVEIIDDIRALISSQNDQSRKEAE